MLFDDGSMLIFGSMMSIVCIINSHHCPVIHHRIPPMNTILPLFIILVTAHMPHEITHSLLPTTDASSLDVTPSIATQLADIEFPPSLMNRFLTEEEEEDRKTQLNEAAFKSLREGLVEAQKRQKYRQRFSKGTRQTEIANRLSAQIAAHQGQKYSLQPTVVDEETLLKQAGLIQQEFIPEEVVAQPTKSAYSELQTALYLTIVILIAIYLVKCIRQRWIANQTRIQSHHEETESLSTM